MNKIREKLNNIFGAATGVVMYALMLIAFFGSFVVLDVPWWADILIILAVVSMRNIAIPVLYTVSFFYLSKASSVELVIFWTSFAIWLLPIIIIAFCGLGVLIANIFKRKK